MKKVNYKSDFDFIFKLTDCRGENIGWPSYDWTLKLWTSMKVNAYTVACKNNNCFNCQREGESIRVIVDEHGLTAGVLQGELTVLLADKLYPDNNKRIVVPVTSDIELVKEAVICQAPLTMEVAVPHELDNGISDNNAIGEPLTRDEIDAAIESVLIKSLEK